jgi:outer membrane protein
MSTTSLTNRLQWIAGWSLMIMMMTPVAWTAEFRIGVVNLPKVTEQAPQAEAAQKLLEREFAPRERELLALQKELQGLEEQLARDGDLMKEDEQRVLERDIRSRQRELVRLQREVREDYNIRRNEELRKLLKVISTTITDLAKSGSYDLVITEGAVYASEKVDMTEAVLGKMKQLFKSAPLP